MTERALLSLAITVALLAGCGVKKHEPVDTSGATTVTEMPAGVRGTHGRLFLFRSSALGFVPGEDNAVSYAFVDDRFRPLGPEYTYLVEYDMPSMPMKGYPRSAPPQSKPGGIVDCTFEIVHGGLWEVRISILKSGEIIDKAVYRVDVPLK
jgi:hypothetical protein